ncbi:MinD-like ATPase involved in chromosome partitioning or flagellar assembly [Actinokineospora baliensis]|uniref:tyrosine-protein kinase family protein n=1 Tax=Actinokineospora baliensis TaxID=547056 RepID=UPI001956864B|nr:AAA family ATPase [Actinokineospora baliensis]MBM7773166.1 MinD-like ATPase involved in chromosome partitioning or flagellar assembly [Actinokineospora baliensis]
MPGTVYTFYSYKGGVGRSFALANIAVLLARWGFRVLCVDWDLEAPGLRDYFGTLTDSAPTGGVVDLVDDFRAGAVVDRTVQVTGTLDLLAAGGDDPNYASRVQSIDWGRLYDEGFGEYLEQCRDRWTARYDYVLLDSRTGISDVGSMCTAQLPDRLVLLFTANTQSIRGAVDVVGLADAARDRLPLDRPRLTVVPVLSRFDSRDEYAQAEHWRDECVDRTRGLYHNWLDSQVSVAAMSRHLTIPYVSYWALGEQLAVQKEKTPSADQISFALETVAALIAHDLDHTALLAENRDAFVAAVRDRKQEFGQDLRVSSSHAARGVANRLIAELRELGLAAEWSSSGDRDLLTRASDNARHLCLVVDGELTRWQQAEAELFLYRTVGQDRRVIPVLTDGTKVVDLPGFVANLRHLRIGSSRGEKAVARDLADQLRGAAAVVEGAPELVGLLVRVKGVRLGRSRWELVDELVRELVTAVGSGDSALAQELAAVLARAIEVPPGSRHDVREALPPHTQEAVEWGIGVLETRVVNRVERGQQEG